MKHPVFKSESFNQDLNSTGYFTRQILTPGEIEDLTSFFHNISLEFGRDLNPKKVQFGAETSQKLFRQQFDKLHTVFQQKIEELFADYEIWQAQFIIKPALAGEMKTHVHPSIIEEDKFVPIGIWVPLQDVNETNGALKILPNSNKMFQALYPRPFDDGPFRKIEKFSDYLLEKNALMPIHLKSGEAIIFEECLLHYSSANLTEKPRLAAAVFVKPKKSQLYYFKEIVKNRKRKITKQKINNKMYFVGEWKNSDVLSEPEIIDAPQHNLSFKKFDFLMEHYRLPKNNLELVKFDLKNRFSL